MGTYFEHIRQRWQLLPDIWNLQLRTEVSSLDLVDWSRTTKIKEYKFSLREIEEWKEAYLKSVAIPSLLSACKLQL